MEHTPHRPRDGWIRQGQTDARAGTPYAHAPGPERHPPDADPATLAEEWSMYLAGLYLGEKDRAGATDEAA
jgi:hypothetical protein